MVPSKSVLRGLTAYRRLCAFSVILSVSGALHAQAMTPNWDLSRWMLGGGIGTNDTLVSGMSFGFVFDPKLQLTPNTMLGSKNIINFSSDDITTLETQAFLRWNFLRLGLPQNPTNLFVQGGMGLFVAYKGNEITARRGSMLFDATAGLTIPLSQRWYIEPSVRAGYPFIAGAAVTAGVRLPIRRTDLSSDKSAEIARTPSPTEIIRSILITQVEYIMFGPDVSRYNVGIDADGRALNDLVINQVAQVLRENPSLFVRVEGHANPISHEPEEINELLVLSEARANEVAGLLRERGVDEGQIVVIAQGGSRILAGDHDHWNVNRRVELMIKQVDVN
jgi:outer membrane protein OmpA-like peptidoglycan-associated protein